MPMSIRFDAAFRFSLCSPMLLFFAMISHCDTLRFLRRCISLFAAAHAMMLSPLMPLTLRCFIFAAGADALYFAELR